jgi:hypothetical protein
MTTDDARETHEGRQLAIREFEAACNYIALVFDADSPQREIAVKARSAMREANGEGAT